MTQLILKNCDKNELQSAYAVQAIITTHDGEELFSEPDVRQAVERLMYEFAEKNDIQIFASAIGLNHQHIVTTNNILELVSDLSAYINTGLVSEFPDLSRAVNNSWMGITLLLPVHDDEHFANLLRYISRHTPDKKKKA